MAIVVNGKKTLWTMSVSDDIVTANNGERHFHWLVSSQTFIPDDLSTKALCEV